MRSAPSFLFVFFFEKVGFFILFGANLVDWCCRLPAALFGKSQWLKTHRLSVWVCLRFEHISHCSARACGPHLNLHLGTWKKNLRISESNLTKVFRLPSSRAVSAARSCSPTALLKSDLLNFRSFHAQGTAEILRRDLSDVLEEDAFAVVSSLLWSAQTQGCQQLACPHKRLPCTCTHTWCYPHTQTCSSTCRFFEPCAPEPLTQLPNATLAESQRDGMSHILISALAETSLFGNGLKNSFRKKMQENSCTFIVNIKKGVLTFTSPRRAKKG